MTTSRYTTKDSGKRQKFDSGMQRDIQEGKPRYDLMYHLQFCRFMEKVDDNNITSDKLILSYNSFDSMWGDNVAEDYYTDFIYDLYIYLNKYCDVSLPEFLDEWTGVMTRGAVKYNEFNWMKAQCKEEYNRFYASGFRHLMQFLKGQDDECHWAAVCFNVGGMMYLQNKGVLCGEDTDK